MIMTRERAIEIIKNHGLYCKSIGSISIALMDKNENVYDIIAFENGLIIDGKETMSIRNWLGY
jgi:hypothetical protein